MWRAFRASAVAGMAFLACGTASAQTAGNFVFSVDGVRQYLAAGQPPVAPEALEAARKDAAATGGVLRAIFVTEKIESIGQTPGMVRLQNGKERAVKPAEAEALAAAADRMLALRKLERKQLVVAMSAETRAGLLAVLEEAAQAGLDPRKAARGGAGWTIEGRAATVAEQAVLDRYETASLAVVAESQKRAAAEADVRIVGDASLAGRSGSGAPRTSAFFSQPVLFNRGAKVVDAFKVQYGALYAMKLEAGDPLFRIADAVCTDKHNFMEVKCFRDTDADGRMETSYFSGYAPNMVLVLGSPAYSEKAPSQPFRVEPAPVADSFGHEIGIALKKLKVDKSIGAYTVDVAMVVRNASEARWGWENLGGGGDTLVIPKGGKGVYEFLGAKVEIEPTGPNSFNWRILSPIPEQPLRGRVAVTGVRYSGVTPMLNVAARVSNQEEISVLPPLPRPPT